MFIIINNIDTKNDNNNIYKHSLQLIKNRLKIINLKKYNSIINSIKLIKLLSNINNNSNTDKYINSINDFINKNEVYIPLNNKKQLKNISKNIIKKDSNTKPIIIEITFIR